MSKLNLTSPLTFAPVFMERVWGGRRLESEFQKKLPPAVAIGESWEMVDRPEAQSVVGNGPLKGKTLHELWTQDRQSIFGDVSESDRFPLLIKLLDAQEKLSLQVHPPEEIARTLGSEPKTEFWYVAAADAGADLFVGLKEPMTREEFKYALDRGTVADCVHQIRVKAGDAMFLPAGRFHAVGAGNLLVEIQQNSDTTYRVFDWNRAAAPGKPRRLHIDEALQSIDFTDAAPGLVAPKGELLVRHELFEIQKWSLKEPREVAPPGQFAIVCCLTGSVRCADVDIAPGGFVLVPASLQDRQLKPQRDETSLLRVTIPQD
jgi:mannose-6-phosphate isomerase